MPNVFSQHVNSQLFDAYVLPVYITHSLFRTSTFCVSSFVITISNSYVDVSLDGLSFFTVPFNPSSKSKRWIKWTLRNELSIHLHMSRSMRSCTWKNMTKLWGILLVMFFFSYSKDCKDCVGPFHERPPSTQYQRTSTSHSVTGSKGTGVQSLIVFLRQTGIAFAISAWTGRRRKSLKSVCLFPIWM